MRYEDLRVGMRVRVTHAVRQSAVVGWDLLWIEDMDPCVGNTYTVHDIRGPSVGVSFDPDEDPSGGCRFHASCLEPAQARAFTCLDDIQPGMRVRITRAALPNEEQTRGWRNDWTNGMNQFVGTTQTVRTVTPAGVYFEIDGPHTNDTPWQGFPWFVLEDVSPTPVQVPFNPLELARPLTDVDLTGPMRRDSAFVRHPYLADPDLYPETTCAHHNVDYAAQRAQVERVGRFTAWQHKREVFKRRMAYNLRDPRPAWRYACVSALDLPCAGQTHKTLGAQVAQLITDARKAQHRSARDLPTDEICEVLNALRRVASDGTAHDVFEMLSSTTYYEDLNDYVRQCDDCQTYTLGDDLHHSEHADRDFCESCCDEYVWSDEMNDYLPEDEACALYTRRSSWRSRSANDWVTRGYGRGSCYEHPDDPEVFFDEDLYYALFPDDEDEDDSHSTSGGNLGDYHRTTRDFREVVTPGSPYPALGVELELYAKGSRSEVVREVRELPDGHICERDGSLDPHQGFEVVTRPFGKPEWGDDKGGVAQRLLDVCQAHGAIGYTELGGMYGIHVTVHRRHLSSLQEARMLMFMSAEPNASFVRAVAQRCNIYHADLDMGSLAAYRQRVSTLGGLGRSQRHLDADGSVRYRRKILGRGKYAPINLKEELAEFRIFQSTTFGPSFMKNLEFVWALIEWTSTAAATGNSWHHEDFCRWLGARAGVKKDYPNLLAYLQREKYRVKGGTAAIRNTWLPALVTAMLTHKLKELPEVKEDESEAAGEAVLETAGPFVPSVAGEQFSTAA